MAGDSSERKKMTNVYLLEILKRYTDDTYDANGNPVHSLTQAQIGELLLRDYDIALDRKAVGRGLSDLINSPEYRDKIGYDTENRKAKIDGIIQDSEMKTNYRYRHDFDAAQIRYLMEAVLFSNSLPKFEREALLELIGNLGSISSKNSISKHIYSLGQIVDSKVSNPEFLANIDIINEAIEKEKQISFTYNNYGKDKKLHPKTGPDGTSVERVVNPYYLIANNGRYYLVCNYDAFDSAIYIRVDKITDIKMLSSPVKPKKNVKGIKDLPSTLTEQLYMQGGHSSHVKFRANKCIISELIDWFGTEIKFGEETENDIICSVKVNNASMKFWAMQYSDHVEILEPIELRNRIKDTLKLTGKKYGISEYSSIEKNDDNEYKDLIEKWKTIFYGADDLGIDIHALNDVVRRTHLAFLPFIGINCDLPESVRMLNVELFKMYHDTATMVKSDKNAVALVIKSLCDDLEKNKRSFLATKQTDDMIYVDIPTKKGKPFFININNFDEDFVTLQEYANKMSERKLEQFKKRKK